MVFVSGQNIDRLKTIYQACCRCNKSFLIDFYTAYVLKTLNKKADNTVPFPSRIAYPNISVYYPSRLTTRMVEVVQKPETVFPFNYYKISKNDLDKMADKLVMLVRPTVQSDLERFFHHYDNASFVYSMWSGYKNQPGRTKDFLDFIESKGVSVKYIHTSGHADIAGLKRMVDAVKPRNIVPIHTFEAGRYAELFQGTDVVMVNDREVIKI
jgi:ribonuclease J